VQATVEYRFHPLFGERLRVRSRCRRAGQEGWIVEIGNGLQCWLPAWMFDAAVCAGLRTADRPSIAAKALTDLVEIVAVGLGALSPDGATPVAAPGDRHAEDTDSATGPTPRPRRRSAAPTGGRAGRGSASARLDAPAGGEIPDVRGGPRG
jgi:hypothetical protein